MSPPLTWACFGAGMMALLGLDLTLGADGSRPLNMRRQALVCALWVALALAFAAGLAAFDSAERAIDFLSGYFIEEALSIDNLFVFLIIFKHFKIPAALQPRVLKWGIFGALAMRALFIVAGAALLARFHAVFYLLGLLLLVTAARLLGHGHGIQPHSGPPTASKWLRWMPWQVTHELEGSAFFVQRDRRWRLTPLALALCVVECSDVLFALDSVPAIFAVTTDAFIVYSSNAFAVLGLRALYFLLADMLHRFTYLHTGLGLILAFVGTKMLLHEVCTISASTSLAVVLGLLALAVAASWRKPVATA